MPEQHPAREQIAALRAAVEGPHPAGSGLDSFTLAYVVGQMNALFQQPTPSAEQVAAWRDRQGDVWTEGDDGLMHTRETAPFSRDHVEKKWGPLVAVTTPPSIADMAPGTKFVHLSATWEVVDVSGHVILRNGPGAGITYRHLSMFDLSMIRDVTPPPTGGSE